MAVKVFRKRRGSELQRGFFKDNLSTHTHAYTHTHTILKNVHGHVVWEKFVLFFSLFFLIYTKHSLTKAGGGQCLLPISLVLWLNERSTGN